MPFWLQIIMVLGGGSGFIALVGSALGFGKVLQIVSDLKSTVDTAIPEMQQDVAYIRGRLDGRQEGLDEVHSTRRRPRVAAIP